MIQSARPDLGRPAIPPRFLQLADVQEILNISTPQAYALVRTGELPAIKIGGRGEWRIEAAELEAYIQRKYAESKARAESRLDEAETDRKG